MTTKPLANMVALVTGGAHRVGKAISLALADAGADVIVHYNAAKSEALETVSQITAMGVKSIAIGANQSKPDELRHLFQEAVAFSGGHVDILVNSANMFLTKPFEEITAVEIDTALSVNVAGPFMCCQEFAKLNRARGDNQAVIVNILDNSATQAWPKMPLHGMCKAAVFNLTKSLARALAPSIRVNGVCPGPILKDPRMPAKKWDEIGARLPLGKAGTAEDVANAVVTLSLSPFITGCIMTVDGGESLIDPQWE